MKKSSILTLLALFNSQLLFLLQQFFECVLHTYKATPLVLDNGAHSSSNVWKLIDRFALVIYCYIYRLRLKGPQKIQLTSKMSQEPNPTQNPHCPNFTKHFTPQNPTASLVLSPDNFLVGFYNWVSYMQPHHSHPHLESALQFHLPNEIECFDFSFVVNSSKETTSNSLAMVGGACIVLGWKTLSILLLLKLITQSKKQGMQNIFALSYWVKEPQTKPRKYVIFLLLSDLKSGIFVSYT